MNDFFTLAIICIALFCVGAMVGYVVYLKDKDRFNGRY